MKRDGVLIMMRVVRKKRVAEVEAKVGHVGVEEVGEPLNIFNLRWMNIMRVKKRKMGLTMELI